MVAAFYKAVVVTVAMTMAMMEALLGLTEVV
jgi:hypothetical protein